MPVEPDEFERCQIGDPGFDSQDLEFFLGVLVGVLPDLGPRTDEAHLAFEHVDQLRQLIQLLAAQKPADAGQPVVVQTGRRTAPGFGIDDHRAKFEDAERLAVPARANSAIKHGSLGIDFDDDAEHEQNRTHQDQTQQARDDVKGAFDAFGDRGHGLNMSYQPVGLSNFRR